MQIPSWKIQSKKYQKAMFNYNITTCVQSMIKTLSYFIIHHQQTHTSIKFHEISTSCRNPIIFMAHTVHKCGQTLAAVLLISRRWLMASSNMSFGGSPVEFQTSILSSMNWRNACELSRVVNIGRNLAGRDAMNSSLLNDIVPSSCLLTALW